MLYSLVEMNRAAMAPLRLHAKATNSVWTSPINPLRDTQFAKSVSAASKVFERATRYYGKPDWQITSTEIDGKECAVEPTTVWATPWCQMVHFSTENVEPERPQLLIVAPLSGHYATLLRGTVQAMLADHDVYVTEWQDARNVPMAAGSFDLDDYIDYIIEFCRFFAGDAKSGILPSSGSIINDVRRVPIMLVPESIQNWLYVPGSPALGARSTCCSTAWCSS